MLIDFRQLWPKYNIKPKGVLHIGANVGEEAPVYLEMGVEKQIWVEGNTEIYYKLRDNLKNNVHAHAYNLVISDKPGIEKFNISSNASQSSSILELGTHAQVHPDVTYIRWEERRAFSIYNLYNALHMEAWFETRDYDFLNIDLQGAELKALKGMRGYLSFFKWAYLEVNKAELYLGCALVEEIDKYLGAINFVRVETSWAGNTNWGDALYIKKDLLP